MRTEISINDLSGAGYLKSALSQANGLDAANEDMIDPANGIRVNLDNRGTWGPIVTVKNTGAAQKSITVLATASHLGATPAVITVPPGETAMLSDFDGQWYGDHGGVDFDFEAGFKGEIAAFRMPGER
jgi:hypothetical protein